jgi:protein-tyrosine-phosphatase
MSTDPAEQARGQPSCGPLDDGRSGALDAQAVEAAAAALRDGAVVGVPTDGFYALAARADRPAARLALSRALEGRGAPPAALVLATAAEIDRCELAGLVRRIARQHWPGPLVIEVRSDDSTSRTSNDAWTALLSSAEPHARALAAAARVPLCIRLVPGACEARGLLELPGVAHVLDRGPSPLCEAPGWLRVARGTFELVREGLYGLELLRASAGLSLRFVCTGNTCRSPMAEGLARAELGKRLGVSAARIGEYGFELASMGTFAAPYQSASTHAVEALSELSIDLGAHRSQLATTQSLVRAQRIYCLTHNHREQVRLLLPPDWNGALLLLDERGDVSDPIGGSLEDYRRCARQIREALERRADEWV